MLEGEPVLDRKLAPKGSPAGMVARIPKGMRAFAVEVNEHTGVSGFILPDHRVDVVQNDTAPNGKAEAETILQDVLVLASGQVFTRPEDRSIQSRTVTLAVTPEQVDILVGAQAQCARPGQCRSHGPASGSGPVPRRIATNGILAMALKDAIRIVLVDPSDDSRQALQRLVSGIGEVWLADVCSQYEGTDKRVA